MQEGVKNIYVEIFDEVCFIKHYLYVHKIIIISFILTMCNIKKET